MKKRLSKHVIIITLIVLIVTLFTLLLIIGSNNTPADPNLKTLSQGRQMRYNEISIGLANVLDKSGQIVIHKDNGTADISKQVKAGDTITAYGYEIEIRSVNRSFNLSTKPGASSGSITFVINKK